MHTVDTVYTVVFKSIFFIWEHVKGELHKSKHCTLDPDVSVRKMVTIPNYTRTKSRFNALTNHTHFRHYFVHKKEIETSIKKTQNASYLKRSNRCSNNRRRRFTVFFLPRIFIFFFVVWVHLTITTLLFVFSDSNINDRFVNASI